MHVATPNDGYTPPYDGTSLWTNTSNQDNLVAIWTNIANRYKDEPTIMGYDLINEPLPVRLPTETAEQALDKYKNLASRIATAIRSVDTNHILFVECAIAICDEHENWEDLPSRISIYGNSF